MMLESLDLRNVIEDVVSSYEARVESIDSFWNAAHLSLGGFQESEKINLQLRDTLAKNEHLRKRDFDRMMQGILAAQDQREKEIKSLLRVYLEEQKKVAQTLREDFKEVKNSLAKNEFQRIKEFQGMIKGIFFQQEKRKKEVTSKLKEFQREQQEIDKGLKDLLGKGRELRIKDLKSMLKEFKIHQEKRTTRQRERKEEVASMLEEFKKERVETSHHKG